MDSATIISHRGALGIGGFLTRIFDTAKERRASRAAVLDALQSTEDARWVTGDNGAANVDWPKAARELRTACLLAQVPRVATKTYLVHARAAYWASKDSYDHELYDEARGGVDSALSTLAEDAAARLADIVWAGRVRRPILVRRMAAEMETHPRLEQLGTGARHLKNSKEQSVVT